MSSEGTPQQYRHERKWMVHSVYGKRKIFYETASDDMVEAITSFTANGGDWPGEYSVDEFDVTIRQRSPIA